MLGDVFVSAVVGEYLQMANTDAVHKPGSRVSSSAGGSEVFLNLVRNSCCFDRKTFETTI